MDQHSEEPIRVRMPRGKELLGVIEEILAGSRFRISCKDGKVRICRVPGRIRSKIKARVGDAVLVEPWDIEPNEKGDVIWFYTPTQARWLRKKGII